MASGGGEDDPVATFKGQVRRFIEAMAAREDAAGLLATHEQLALMEELRQDVVPLRLRASPGRPS